MIGLVRIRRVSRVETLFAVWSLVVVLGVGCGEQPEPTRVTRSLIDTPAAADVLVGAARLDPPSSLAGNRLLTGWTRTRVSGRTAWLPDPVGATIEFVNIGDHPRRLEITTENPGLESEITISLSGRDLGTWSLEPKTVIPLPDDLPLGRVPLRLVFGSPVVVKHLSVRPARSKGSVDFIGDTISQRPSSVVEIVGLIGSDARLKGRFEPPVEAAGNQRFEIVVDAGSAHGPEVVHRWRKRGSSSTVSNIDVPLPSGLVAIRLVARGRGAPASWEGLRIVEDASSPGSGAAHPPKPPRLVVL